MKIHLTQKIVEKQVRVIKGLGNIPFEVVIKCNIFSVKITHIKNT